MNKLSLINIILKEGLLISLEDPLDKESRITHKKSSLNPIPGEQLVYNPGVREAYGYPVLYTLVSSKEEGIIAKPVMDVVKEKFDQVSKEVLPLVKSEIERIKSFFTKDSEGYQGPDYIFFLQSEQTASQKLSDYISSYFSKAEVHRLSKLEFVNLFQALNWDNLKDLTEEHIKTILAQTDAAGIKRLRYGTRGDFMQDLEKIKSIFKLKRSWVKINGVEVDDYEEIQDYLDANLIDFPAKVTYLPYQYISKGTGFAQLRKHFISKYDTFRGRDMYSSPEDYKEKKKTQHTPYNPEDKPIEEVYDRRLLIIDENLHSGTDMKNVFQDLINIEKRNRKEALENAQKELEKVEEMLKIVQKSFDTFKYHDFVDEFLSSVNEKLFLALGTTREELSSRRMPQVSNILKTSIELYTDLAAALKSNIETLLDIRLDIVGYVLYRIEDEDIRIFNRRSATEEGMSKDDKNFYLPYGVGLVDYLSDHKDVGAKIKNIVIGNSSASAADYFMDRLKKIYGGRVKRILPGALKSTGYII